MRSRYHLYGCFCLLLTVTSGKISFGQSLGNAGTVEGMVVDPSGSAVPKATITFRNAVSGYSQTATTDADGSFRLSNIPPNPYHLEVTAPGFSAFTQDVDIRNSIPVRIKATMELAGAQTTVTVEAAGADILENSPAKPSS